MLDRIAYCVSRIVYLEALSTIRLRQDYGGQES